MEGYSQFPQDSFIPEGLQRAPTILIVDDDQTICKLLEFHMKGSGCNVLKAYEGEQALRTIKKHPLIDLVLLDLRLPGMTGLETLKEILKTGKVPCVIVMTAYGTMEDAIQALKEGAYDFVNKSANFDDLRLSIRNALQTIVLREEVESLKARLSEEKEEEFSEVIGTSESMKQVMKLVRKVKNSDITVLIQGESGSGKEIIARAIHFKSRFLDKPFVAINCAAIPENLLESELFGHTKGAFTGATTKRIGRFEEASDGTIFLDEIGEMSAPLQAKLLRVLQTKEIEPIGGPTKKVNVRIISATNQDLSELVLTARFRQDLYYRLAVFPIMVPPLRDRPDDIPPLMEHFVRRFADQEGKLVAGVSPEVERELLLNDWPGNVRELENMIYRAVVLSDSPILQLKDFPVFSLSRPRRPSPVEISRPGGPESEGGTGSKVLSMEEMEEIAILEALKISGGNISKAAGQLKIGRATLYRKFKKFGISPR